MLRGGASSPPSFKAGLCEPWVRAALQVKFYGPVLIGAVVGQRVSYNESFSFCRTVNCNSWACVGLYGCLS